MFIRRSRAHPLTALPTPVARRKFIKENLLVICIPRTGSSVWEMLPARSALVGKMREGGVSVEVVDESDPSLQTYTARLRQAALRYVADPANTHLIELLHTEIEIVGRNPDPGAVPQNRTVGVYGVQQDVLLRRAQRCLSDRDGRARAVLAGAEPAEREQRLAQDCRGRAGPP